MRSPGFLADSLKTVVGGVAASASLFMFNVVAATVLSQREFGALVAALAHVNLGLTVAGFGIAGFFAKAFVEHPIRFKASGRAIFAFCVLASFTSALIIIAVAFSAFDEVVRSVTLTLVPMVLGYSAAELAAANAQVQGRFNLVALWLAGPGLLRLVLLLPLGVLAEWSLDVETVALSVAAASVLVTTLAIRTAFEMVTKTGFWNSSSESSISVVGVLKIAAPFGTANGLYLLYSQAPILVLSQSVSIEIIGAYGVAMMVVMSAYLVPSLVVQRVLLVDIIKIASTDSASARKFLIKAASGSMVMGLITAIFLFFLIGFFAPHFFSYKYSEAPRIASILLLALPIRFGEAVVGGFLMAKLGIYYKNLSTVISLIVQYPLLIYAVTNFGAEGAAGVYVFTEFVLFSCYVFWVRHRVLSNAT